MGFRERYIPSLFHKPRLLWRDKELRLVGPGADQVVAHEQRDGHIIFVGSLDQCRDRNTAMKLARKIFGKLIGD